MFPEVCGEFVVMGFCEGRQPDSDVSHAILPAPISPDQSFSSASFTKLAQEKHDPEPFPSSLSFCLLFVFSQRCSHAVHKNKQRVLIICVTVRFGKFTRTISTTGAARFLHVRNQTLRDVLL